jgi:hypothetical protein
VVFEQVHRLYCMRIAGFGKREGKGKYVGAKSKPSDCKSQRITAKPTCIGCESVSEG